MWLRAGMQDELPVSILPQFFRCTLFDPLKYPDYWENAKEKSLELDGLLEEVKAQGFSGIRTGGTEVGDGAYCVQFLTYEDCGPETRKQRYMNVNPANFRSLDWGDALIKIVTDRLPLTVLPEAR